MNKNYKDIREIPISLTKRSVCSVQVGSILFDNYGIFSWGWNHSGNSGYGTCAESHAISRANHNRMRGSTIVIVSIRRNKYICSYPCNKCMRAIRAVGINRIYCLNKSREWYVYEI